MPKFRENFPEKDPDPVGTEKWIREYREGKRESIAKAEEISGIMAASIESTSQLVNNSEIFKHLSRDDQEKVEKIRRVWEVEVAGKMRAYVNSGKERRMNQSFDVLYQAQRIVRPAIQNIILEKAREYGIETPDLYDEEKTPEALSRFAMRFPNQVISGQKKFEDLEKELEAVIDKLTQT